MRPTLQQLRRRIRARRWPGRDELRSQAAELLGAWRSRSSPAVAGAPPREERPGGSRPPVLSRVVRVRRVDAVVHVEIVAEPAALDRTAPVLARDAAGPASAGAAPHRGAAPAGEQPALTVTFGLN